MTIQDDLKIEAGALAQDVANLKGVVTAFTRGSDHTLHADLLRADQASYSYPLTKCLILENSTSQVMNSNNWEAIVFNNILHDDLRRVAYSTASTGRFTASGQNGVLLMFMGRARWDANSSGVRFIRLAEFTTYGPRYTLISAMLPVSGGDTIGDINCMYIMREDTSGFEIQGFQNGGGALLMQGAGFGLIEIGAGDHITDTTRTFIAPEPTDHGYISNTDPDSTGGHNSTIIVLTKETEGGGGPRALRSFIQFDLAQLQNVTIDDIVSASLDMWCTATSNNSSVTESGDVYRCTGAWSGDTNTWNTQPTVSSTSMGSFGDPSAYTTGTMLSFSLSTEEIREMISTNYGMRLNWGNEDIGSTNAEMIKWLGTGIAPYFWRWPRLVVKYTEA